MKRELHPEVKKRQRIERAVIRAFVKAALTDKCEISVYDGEQYPLKRSNSESEIMKAIMSTDEDRLNVWKDGKQIGWVFLVYGNDGWDVINDYTVSLEYLMAEVTKISDRYEAA